MYATSLQHILAELERLDLLLRIQAWRARQGRGEAGELAAFYIPEAEADEFLDKAIGTPVWAGVPLPPELQETAQATLDRLAQEIARHTADSLDQGVPLRLAGLSRIFGLTEFDLHVILLCLAPELDRGYERLYGYLHDDVTRRQPTADLALSLFCPGLASKVAARKRLTPAGPLLGSRLVELRADPGSLLGGVLRLEPRVASYLLEDDAIDDRLPPYAKLIPLPAGIPPATGLGHAAFPEAFARRLSKLAEHARTACPGTCCTSRDPTARASRPPPRPSAVRCLSWRGSGWPSWTPTSSARWCA